jgi:hypothetical protein
MSSRPLRCLLILALLASAGACARPHDELPPFDPARAKALSAEKRSEYNIRFFNEFASRNHTRGRGTFEDCKRHDKLFREMAAEGYEVAHIALQLYDIGRCRLEGRYYEAARQRLEALAGQGDTAAMCFIVPGITITKSGVSGDYARYIRDGAERGQPHCMLGTGGGEEWFLKRTGNDTERPDSLRAESPDRRPKRTRTQKRQGLRPVT